MIVWFYQIGAEQKSNKPTANKSLAERKAANAAILEAGPTTRIWKTPEGQLIEIKIPSPAVNGYFVEIKRCVVWRGVGGDSLHCESPDAMADSIITAHSAGNDIQQLAA